MVALSKLCYMRFQMCCFSDRTHHDERERETREPFFIAYFHAHIKKSIFSNQETIQFPSYLSLLLLSLSLLGYIVGSRYLLHGVCIQSVDEPLYYSRMGPISLSLTLVTGDYCGCGHHRRRSRASNKNNYLTDVDLN